ncbi:MAG: hypothetical protein M1824_002672 [Vezdaea acicularis]|nr:MAG: hypothetical protein M1824_002672 [Vezdaea acicularis]
MRTGYLKLAALGLASLTHALPESESVQSVVVTMTTVVTHEPLKRSYIIPNSGEVYSETRTNSLLASFYSKAISAANSVAKASQAVPYTLTDPLIGTTVLVAYPTDPSAYCFLVPDSPVTAIPPWFSQDVSLQQSIAGVTLNPTDVALLLTDFVTYGPIRSACVPSGGAAASNTPSLSSVIASKSSTQLASSSRAATSGVGGTGGGGAFGSLSSSPTSSASSSKATASVNSVSSSSVTRQVTVTATPTAASASSAGAALPSVEKAGALAALAGAAVFAALM